LADEGKRGRGMMVSNDDPYRKNVKPLNAPPKIKLPTFKETLVDLGKAGMVILNGLWKLIVFLWYAFWTVVALLLVGLFAYYAILPVYIYWIVGVSIIILIFLSTWLFKFISARRQHRKEMAEYNMENGK
jgi:hypothetical protein